MELKYLYLFCLHRPKLIAQSFIYQVTMFDQYSDAFRRRPHLQGVQSQMLTFQHVIRFQTTVRQCVA